MQAIAHTSAETSSLDDRIHVGQQLTLKSGVVKNVAQQMVDAAHELRVGVGRLRFDPPVTHVTIR